MYIFGVQLGGPETNTVGHAGCRVESWRIKESEDGNIRGNWGYMRFWFGFRVLGLGFGVGLGLGFRLGFRVLR